MKSKFMVYVLVGALMIPFVSMRAEANVPDNVDTSVIDEEYDSSGQALTPEGNLTIVDDIEEKPSAKKKSDVKKKDGEKADEAAGGKQFITVTTKSGNIFYLIIDRDDSGENTVHFLNLVDERDLLSLLDDDEIKVLEKEKEAAKPVTTTTENTGTQDSEKTEDVKEKTTKKTNKSDILVMCILLGMAGVGGLYFYSNKSSFIKKKKGPIIDDGEEYIEIPSESEDKDYDDIPVE